MLQNYMQEMPVLATPDAIRKMVLKLRWIGLEAEADQLRQRLDAAAPGESVAFAPSDTD